MVDYVETKRDTGNLKALCEACGATMHRRTRHASLGAVMPGITVQIRQAPERLIERPLPSLNCDIGGEGMK
jgi:hypothetical protein